jgi:ADP-ribose pyrophosphatase
MDFEVIESSNLFKGKVFDLRRERVRYPDGRQVTVDIIAHGGAVVMVPVDKDGNVWFVRQYRHATGELLLELPAGTLEQGEPPEDCAHRELREEIGMAAGEVHKVGEFFLAPGYSNEFMHVFLATQLHPDALEHDSGEYLQVEQYPVGEVFEMLTSGAFRDAKTLAALSLVRDNLEKES